MGFLAYVASMKEKAESRLFPELKLGANGYYSDPFSKWFNDKGRFLGKIGAKRPGTSFHSFWHNYRDALREADISLERVRALGGWAGNTGEEARSEEHTSELQSLMRISYAVFGLKKQHQ